MEVDADTDGLQRARALLAAGRYVDAAALAHHCAGLRPGDPYPLITAAWAESGLNRLDAAEHAAREAVGHAPDLPDAHLALASVLIRRARRSGRYRSGMPARRAVAAARHLLEVAPNSVVSQLVMGDACIAAKRVRGSIDASDAALRMDPLSTDAWVLRSTAARLARDYPVAEAAARQALRLEPDSYVANNELGIVLRLRGHTTEALQQFAATAAAQPLAPQARANFVRYGAPPLYGLLLLLTSPVLLVVHQVGLWLVGTAAINAVLWRSDITRRRLDRWALGLSRWRSRYTGPIWKRRPETVGPGTPIQRNRSGKTVLVLSFLFLLWASAVATGGAIEAAPVLLPVCLLVDVPTCVLAWKIVVRYLPRRGGS